MTPERIKETFEMMSSTHIEQERDRLKEGKP